MTEKAAKERMKAGVELRVLVSARVSFLASWLPGFLSGLPGRTGMAFRSRFGLCDRAVDMDGRQVVV